jgi:ubiquitin-conjugating enzyme E2 G2
MNKMGMKRLAREFAEITARTADDGFVAGPLNETDLFTWEAVIAGPEGTCYDGGCFHAILSIPPDYPISPPTMRFTCEMHHPNVYQNGNVCISILHTAEDVAYAMYEQASEQWSPVQSLEKVLLSVMSMLAEPNDESAANLDAAKQWRTDRAAFNARAQQTARKSLGFE